MKRKFYQKLINWKENNLSMPLMVVGARQIGKTYLIDEFCKNNFEDYIYINLDKSENIQKIFDETINPEEILPQLELILNKTIDIEKTILFFDEIQVSERAISSLKYFCESKKNYKIQKMCSNQSLNTFLIIFLITSQ